MQKTLARNAVFNIVYRILNVIFPLFSTAYVSRILSPEGIGNVAYVRNIVSYFVMIAVLGIPRYGTREIAKNRNDKLSRNRVFSEILIINTVSTAACVLLYIAFMLGGVLRDSAIYLVCGLELVFNFINIDWLYEGEEEYAYITKRSIAIKVISIVALFIFVKNEEDYLVYALITCLGLGCNYIFNVVHARKCVKLTFCNLEIRRHLGPVLVLALSVVASSLYSKVNVTILGWLCPMESVGYYTNAHKVVNMALTLVTAISGVFMPRLSFLYSNDIEQYRKLITIGAKTVLYFAIPCAVGIALTAENSIMVLFGERFVPAKMTLQIMAVLIVLIGVGDLLCYQAIISSGNEKMLIRSRIYAGVANVILSLILVPVCHHTGAAIAAVVSETIVNGMLLKKALQIAKPRVEKGFFFKLFIGVTTMAVVVISVQMIIHIPLLSLVTAIGVGALTYLIVERIVQNDFMTLIRQLKAVEYVRCETICGDNKNKQ